MIRNPYPLVAFVAALLFSVLNSNAQYCASSFGSTAGTCDDEYLSRVRLSNLDNSSGVDCSYGNYTAVSPAVVGRGQSYTANITVTNTFSATDHVTIWIDWNQDQTFDNSGTSNEKFYLGSIGGTGNKNFTGTVTVPAGASFGNTRMRVSVKYNSQATPCENGASSYGEVEDYTVNVCGAADGNTISSNVSSVCGGSSVTLTVNGSLTGKSIQWQRSTDGVNYTNIAGATGTTRTESPSTDTYYRVVLTNTCSGTTNPHLISVVTKPVVSAGPDKTICEGESAVLEGTSSVGKTASYSNSFTTTVEDGTGWYNQTFSVTGLYPGTMNDASSVSIVSVCVNIDHTWNSDLQIQVVSPSGTAINLANGDGGTGDNFRNVCFKTNAATAINAGGNQNFNGDYRPRQAFSLLNGDQVNGTWTVRVRDNSGGSDGTWRFASITFNTGTTFTWSPSTNLSSSTVLQPSADPSTSTNYTLTVANGSCSTSDQMTLTVKPKPNTSAITGDDALCQGETRIYSVSNTSGNSYAWTLTGGGSISSGQGSNQISVNWNTAGSWQVSVTETGANGCPDDPVTFGVDVFQAPTVNAGANRTICRGATTSLGGSPTASGGSGNFSYAWSPSTGLSATNVANPNANPTSTRTYTLLVTDLTSGCSTSKTVKVTVVDPIVASAGGNKTICQGESVSIGGSPSASAGSGDYSYSWSPATGLSATNVANPNANPTTTTTYTLTVSDNQAGCSAQSSVTVNVNPIPTATISSNSPQCDGFEAQFLLNPNSNDSNPMSFSWTGVNGWTSTQEDPTRNDPYPDMNGNHSVVITNTVTGCKSITYTENFVQQDRPAALAFRVDPVKAQYCVGEDINFEADVNAGGLLDPDWQSIVLGGPNGVIQTVNNDNGTIAFNPITLGAGDGGRYWVVGRETAGSCITDTAFINIVVFETNSFTATNNGPICEGGTVNLSVTDGGTGVSYSWSGPNAYTASTRNASRSSLSATDAGVYTVDIDNGNCPAFSVSTTVEVDAAPNAGTNTSVKICEDENSFELFTALNGNPDATGSWTDVDNSGGFYGDYINATEIGPGSFDYRYTVPSGNTCPNQSAVLSVEIIEQAKAGADGSASICNTESAFDLSTQLTNADNGGTWTNLDNVGSLSGAIWDATGVAAGTYDFKYEVSPSDPACPVDEAIISVTVKEKLNAGENNSITLCESATSFALFNQLGGTPDAGGSWTALSSSTGFDGSNFDPSNSDGPGTYDFQYTVSEPGCPDASATLSVTLIEQSNAGADNNIALCNTENDFDLNSMLDANAQGGGTWSSPSGGGTLTGNSWDNRGLAAGDYTFVYTITDPSANCPDDAANFTISLSEEANPGTGTSIAICESGAVLDLFAQLSNNPDNDGFWENTDNATGFSGTSFDPGAGDAAGTYRFAYHIDRVACPRKTAVVSVDLHHEPFVGASNNDEICANTSSYDLNQLLSSGVSTGGTWVNQEGQGQINGADWQPQGANPGLYNFTYTLNDPSAVCPSAQQNFTITLVAPGNPGDDAQILACEDENNINLFDVLGANAETGGFWTNVQGHPGFANGILDASAAASGTYIFVYSVENAPCATQSAQVKVEVKSMPQAGTGGSINACNSQSNIDLEAALSGSYQTNGTWINNSGAGSLNGQFWDARTASAGSYTFDYQVSDPDAACADVVSTVTVELTESESPGLDNELDVCQGTIVIDLFKALGGNPSNNGTWQNVDNALGYSNGTFDPSAGDAAGTYLFEYHLTGGPCPDSKATITINLKAPPFAGNDATVDRCNTDNAIDLLSVVGGDNGGSWQNQSGAGSLNGNLWDATGLAAGDYDFIYTLSEASGTCPDASATATISLKEQKSAGENANITICNTTVIDLLSQLGGNPDSEGTWTEGVDGTGATISPALFNANGKAAGVYNFRYDISSEAPCQNDFAILQITVEEQPNAGNDANLDICNNASPRALFPELGSDADNGGVWTNPSGSSHSGTFNPSNDADGDYTYTIDGGAVCQTVSADVTVSKRSAPTITVVENCSPTNLGYRIEVTANGGDQNTYTASATYNEGAGDVPFSGTWSGNVWTSNLIPTPSSYTVNVDDAFACGPASYSNSYECGCASQAGDMQSDTLFVCPLSPAAASYDASNQILDPDDGFNFIVHEKDENGAFGVILAVNKSAPFFSFDPGSMVYDKTYYISAVVGNEDVNGNVDLNDGCLSISNRTPVWFISPLQLQTGGDLSMCEGASVQQSFVLQGARAPFTLEFASGATYPGIDQNNNSITLNPTASTTYTVDQATDDKGCSHPVGVSFQVEVLPTPDFNMSISNDYCDGTGQPVLTFVDQNSGGYSYQINLSTPTGNLSFSTADSLVAAMADPGIGQHSYILKSIQNERPEACSSSPNTQVNIEVFELPAIDLDGDKSLCENQAGQIELSFTQGQLPFSLTYNDGINPDVQANGISNNPWVLGVNHISSTTYNFKQVVDANGCVLNADSLWPITINPIPQLNSVSVDKDEICSGENVQVLFDISGNGPFTVDYDLNGNNATAVVNGVDPFTVNHTAPVGSSASQTYSYTITRIQDSSTPQCVNNVNGNESITVYPIPVGSIGLDQSPICENSQATLRFNFSGVGSFNYSYQVNGGSVSNVSGAGTTSSQSFVPPSGVEQFVYTLVDVTATAPSGHSCSATLQLDTQLDIHLLPDVSMNGFDSLCLGDSRPLTFNISRTKFPVTVDIQEQSGGLVSTFNGLSNGDEVNFSPDASGVYRIVQAYDESALACAGSFQGKHQFEVLPLPQVDLKYASNVYCEEAEVPLDFIIKDAVGGYTLEYLQNGISKKLSSSKDKDSVRVNFTLDVDTDIELLRIVNNTRFACATLPMETHSFTAIDKPIARFDFDPQNPTVLNPFVSFENQSDYADRFEWKLDGDIVSTNEHFADSLPDDDARRYTMWLIAYVGNDNSCVDSTYRFIWVEGQLFVHIPNTFTPNGDGKNETFKPVMDLVDPEHYEFSILNRWGETIFKTYDPAEAWDGRVNGEGVPDGMYIYKLIIKDKNSVEKFEKVDKFQIIR